MIAFIKGEIVSVSEDEAVIDTGPVGYNVRISTGTANLLPPVGHSVRLHTYTHVREDAFQLYGFLTRDDVGIFKKLISVSGVGPKGGLAVLSVMSADDLRFAILSGDARAITQAPGIGAKTAERIILDLRDKLASFDGLTGGGLPSQGAIGAATLEGDAKNEAVEALMALGYGATDALKAVKKVATDEQTTTEAILRAALKQL